MSCNKIKLAALAVFTALAVTLTACAPTADSESADSITAENTAVTSDESENDMFTDRDKEIGYDESSSEVIQLADGASKCGSDSVKISDDTVTLTDEGTYIFSGSLSDGQIIVDADKKAKLRLVLNGVSINCDDNAAIYVKQADKVFITLAKGTENTLSNKNGYVNNDENNVDSVIFSKEDLTLNGSGTLTVNAAYGHGIVSKDDLVITSGKYNVTAASHTLCGKDSVRIADGSFTLTAGKDGIHAENSDDTSLGFIYIAGGDFGITSNGDGMDSSASLQVCGGTINITAGGGCKSASKKQSDNMRPDAQSSADDTESVSQKGLKSDGTLTVSGGIITADCADDTVHSNSDLSVEGGTLTLSSGDDGMHADGGLKISGGTISVTQSYEGLEGKTIDISGGEISLKASDDGLNAAGGNDESGFGGSMKRDEFKSSGENYIKISGGKLTVDADGDGIDSNGDLEVSGGETYVSGPTSDGDGAVDYDGDAKITGGIFIAAGSSGMAQNFGSDSTQGAILVNTASRASGEITLKNSDNEVIASFSPSKAYSSVVMSCPEIKKGASYTLTAAGQTSSINMTDIIYGSSDSMGMGGNDRGGMGQMDRAPGGKGGMR